MVELTPGIGAATARPGLSTTPTAAALVDVVRELARGVAAFPDDELKGVEPPLRSTPGPMRMSDRPRRSPRAGGVCCAARQVSPDGDHRRLPRAHRAPRPASQQLHHGHCPTQAAPSGARRRTPRSAAGDYRGPLHGVPSASRTSSTWPASRPPSARRSCATASLQQTPRVVARLKQAGAVILGKHNLHEFAFGITSENPHYRRGAQSVGPRPCAGRLERRHGRGRRCRAVRRRAWAATRAPRSALLPASAASSG